MADVFAAHPAAPVYTGTDEVLAQITGFHLHRGALAAMDRPAPRTVDEVLAGARRVAILENVSDHTNLGAIFRSAAGLGVDAVLVTPESADPLNRAASASRWARCSPCRGPGSERRTDGGVLLGPPSWTGCGRRVSRWRRWN